MTREQSIQQLQGLMREWHGLLKTILLDKLSEEQDTGRWPAGNRRGPDAYRLAAVIDHCVDLAATLPYHDLADHIEAARDHGQVASTAPSYEAARSLIDKAIEELGAARQRCSELLREPESSRPGAAAPEPTTTAAPAPAPSAVYNYSYHYHGSVGVANSGVMGNVGTVHIGSVASIESLSIINNSVKTLVESGNVAVAVAFTNLANAIQGHDFDGVPLAALDFPRFDGHLSVRG